MGEVYFLVKLSIYRPQAEYCTNNLAKTLLAIGLNWCISRSESVLFPMVH